MKYVDYMRAAKVAYLTDLMRDHAGNVTVAASAAGLNRQHLTKLLSQHAIVRAQRPSGRRGNWAEFRL